MSPRVPGAEDDGTIAFGSPKGVRMSTRAFVRRACVLVVIPLFIGVGVETVGATQLDFGRMVSAGRSFNTVSSSNWGGYASTKGPFTKVSATWVQPAVKCGSATTYASFWVGLDGFNSNSVEQTGTLAVCNGGTATYSAWVEFFPAAPRYFNAIVKAGDVFHASVTESGGVFTTKLNNATRHWTGIAHKTVASAPRSSAEIIAEAPSNSSSVLPLANFGTMNFTNALVNGATIGSKSPIKIIMRTSAHVKAQPSALSSGKNFSVTWHHS
jgi:hypothetical protein